MINYHAVTPSAGFKDKDNQPLEASKNNITLGIRFNENHEAFFNDLTVKKSLELTAAEVAQKMVLDFGYKVTVVNDDRTETPFDPHTGPSPKQAAPRAPAKTASKTAAPA